VAPAEESRLQPVFVPQAAEAEVPVLLPAGTAEAGVPVLPPVETAAAVREQERVALQAPWPPESKAGSPAAGLSRRG